MPYTGTPKTWTAGSVLTASDLNAELRDPLITLLSTPRVAVSNSTGHSHTSGTSLLLTWDTEAYDTDNLHSTSTNTSRITATTAGLYQITARQAFAANATGIRSLDVRKNAAGSSSGGTRIGYDSQTPVSGAVTSVCVICDVFLNAGDYLEAFGFQSSGGALSDDATAGLTMFQARLVATT